MLIVILIRHTLLLILYYLSSNKSNNSLRLNNREIGGLLKGAAATGCTDLTLIMMSGEEEDIEVNGLTIHKVLAIRWLKLIA